MYLIDYPKSQDGESRYSECKLNNQADKDKHVRIDYDKGIQVEHVIASTSVPINYDYDTLEGEIVSDDNKKCTN